MKCCFVKECRFADSHTTIAHKCGTCGEDGHGVIECCRPHLIRELNKHGGDKMPYNNRCNIEGCSFDYSHNRHAHHCGICGQRATHSQLNCPINVGRQISLHTEPEPEPEPELINKKCPTCNIFSNIDILKTIFVDSECIICFDKKKIVIFDKCKHANVCIKCVVKL